jgi:predicted RNA-binding protein Jag
METQGQDGLDDRAIREVHEGIQAVLNGAGSIDLTPQKASVRRQQHELVRQAELFSHSYGKEPERHIRIYR